jgi:hypothetical protein
VNDSWWFIPRWLGSPIHSDLRSLMGSVLAVLVNSSCFKKMALISNSCWCIVVFFFTPFSWSSPQSLWGLYALHFVEQNSTACCFYSQFGLWNPLADHNSMV